MYVTKSINADHEDLIHDVAYDFYGKRMATCSSDQKVKVRVCVVRPLVTSVSPLQLGSGMFVFAGMGPGRGR